MDKNFSPGCLPDGMAGMADTPRLFEVLLRIAENLKGLGVSAATPPSLS